MSDAALPTSSLTPCSAMSDVFFILGRDTVYLPTPDTFRGVLLASNEVRTEVLQH